MFARLGRLVSRRPRRTVFVWFVAAVACYLVAIVGAGGNDNLFARVDSGAPQVAGSESARGTALLAAAQDGDSVTLLVQHAPPATKGLTAALAPLHEDLAAIAGVDTVVDPFVLPDGPASAAAKPLIAADGQGFIVVVDLKTDLSSAELATARAAVVERLRGAGADLADVAPDATVLVGNDHLVVSAITDQLERDLRTGEAVALPIALVIMILVFGGFLAASMPIAGALASIGTGFGVLYAMTSLMEVDATVINVVTVLGIGLSIDYGLLVVSRFREELLRRQTGGATPTRRRRRDADVHDALLATLSTAGKTVAFSAVTVAISVASLAVFRPSLTRAIGFAGVAVILLAVLSALTLVPALLAMSGRRLARKGILGRIVGVRALLRRTADVTSDEGVFSRLAGRVQRHPLLVLVGCLAVLAVLASPLLGLQLRNSGIQLLPASSEPRQFVTVLSEQYPGARSPEIEVVVEGTAADARSLAASIADIDGVSSVDAAQQAGDVAVLGVRTADPDAGSSAVVEVVHEIRALRDAGGTPTYFVIGQAAGQVDFATALGDRVWIAVGIVAAATLVLLFLMTGSVVLPVKALLTNAISLFASLGVLVWVFQEGHLSGPLGFTSAGGIEIYVVALVVAFAFGLAMDYEVFLLSRVKELHDQGVPSADAVRLGLQRSGRIITSAAVIIVVVFAGFAAGQLLVTKEVGFALAVAVLLDATLVRMLLVPATMTLLGSANWWAPRFLRRISDRTAIRHG